MTGRFDTLCPPIYPRFLRIESPYISGPFSAADQRHAIAGKRGGVSPAGSFVVFINIRILGRRFANYGKHFRVAGLRHLLAEADDLDPELPMVTVVEQEQHFAADLRERLSHRRALHASRLAVGAHLRDGNVVQIGEEFVPHRRVVDVPAELAEETEGVVEIEPEGAHDGGGEVV